MLFWLSTQHDKMSFVEVIISLHLWLYALKAEAVY